MDQVRESANSGLVDIESHAHRHALVLTSGRVLDFANPRTLARYDIYDWPLRNTPAGDRVLTVKTSPAGDDMIRVHVRDAGHGIAAGDLPQIFESFFTTKADGLGLGLAIARSLVSAWGGRIWADNNEDGGATFSFIVPVDTALERARQR